MKKIIRYFRVRTHKVGWNIRKSELEKMSGWMCVLRLRKIPWWKNFFENLWKLMWELLNFSEMSLNLSYISHFSLTWIKKFYSYRKISCFLTIFLKGMKISDFSEKLGILSKNRGISLKISYFLSRSREMYENLRLSELMSLLYFYISLWRTQINSICSRVYENISIFQHIICIFFWIKMFGLVYSYMGHSFTNRTPTTTWHFRIV